MLAEELLANESAVPLVVSLRDLCFGVLSWAPDEEPFNCSAEVIDRSRSQLQLVLQHSLRLTEADQGTDTLTQEHLLLRDALDLEEVERLVEEMAEVTVGDELAPLLEGLEQQLEHGCALRSFQASVMELLMAGTSVLERVMKDGFCRPKEEPLEDETAVDKLGEGTGMGEGTGVEDVSHEIEDEEQLLGLRDHSMPDEEEKQTDKPEQQEVDADRPGMDMTEEFEGEMFDVKEDDQKEEQGEDEDLDDESELDREMGETNRDRDQVVDEQLWDPDDNEDEPDGDDEDEGADEKQRNAPPRASDEIAAK